MRIVTVTRQGHWEKVRYHLRRQIDTPDGCTTYFYSIRSRSLAPAVKCVSYPCLLLYFTSAATEIQWEREVGRGKDRDTCSPALPPLAGGKQVLEPWALCAVVCALKPVLPPHPLFLSADLTESEELIDIKCTLEFLKNRTAV